MPYYRTCPYCGAHLDPGERCDCPESQRARIMDLAAQLTVGEKLKLREFLKNILASAANTDEDGVEQITTPASISSVPENGGLVNG